MMTRNLVQALLLCLAIPRQAPPPLGIVVHADLTGAEALGMSVTDPVRTHSSYDQILMSVYAEFIFSNKNQLHRNLVHFCLTLRTVQYKISGNKT